ncbi:MAG: PEGA domain-containing protein [Bacteroidota bacterium]|nr:PEGA domain-containing protein [Bacteroidota bacterium]
MKSILKYITYFCFIILIFTHTHAQDNVVIPESRISIYCNVQNAKIFLDTTLVGYTPLENYTVKPGFYVLRVLSPDECSWFSKSYIDSIQIQLNENFVKKIELEYIWFISSSPSGAGVYYKDSLIGKTPTVFYSKSDINVITFNKAGYEKLTIPNDKNNSRIDVELQPKEQNILIHQNKYLSNDGNKLQGSVYVAAGGTVLFGATAIYTKIKADEYYKLYRKTGDASLLTKVRKLDTYSGISLVVAEISSLLLTYLLLSK